MTKRINDYILNDEELYKIKYAVDASAKSGLEIIATMCAVNKNVYLSPFIGGKRDRVEEYEECSDNLNQRVGTVHTHGIGRSIPSPMDVASADLLSKKRKDKGIMCIGSTIDGLKCYKLKKPLTKKDHSSLENTARTLRRLVDMINRGDIDEKKGDIQYDSIINNVVRKHLIEIDVVEGV